MMLLLLALACSETAAPPAAEPKAEAPPASIDDLVVGTVFMAEMWGDDITPEQERRFETVAGELYADEKKHDGIAYARVQALEEALLAPTPDVEAVGQAALQVASADRGGMEKRVTTICKLIDVLEPAQREARRVAGRVDKVLREGLPSSATNAYDFAAPWLKSAYDGSARAERARVDAGWGSVAASMAAADPELATIDVQAEGWCVRYRQALGPTQDAWARWHKDSVVSFATWLAGRSVSSRTTFLQTGHLADAMKWSVGSVTRTH